MADAEQDPTPPVDEMDDATTQATEAQQSPAQPAPAEAALREKVAALEAREKELIDRLARLQADFENFRRRSREEAASATGRAKEQFVKALLPVLDNLERALTFTEDEGLRLLSRQLQSTLAAQGLLVLDPTGEAFDAKVHEAVAQESKDGAKAGTVLTTLEKGYALEGRILRPARVIVAA